MNMLCHPKTWDASLGQAHCRGQLISMEAEDPSLKDFNGHGLHLLALSPKSLFIVMQLLWLPKSKDPELKTNCISYGVHNLIKACCLMKLKALGMAGVNKTQGKNDWKVNVLQITARNVGCHYKTLLHNLWIPKCETQLAFEWHNQLATSLYA